MNNAVMFKQIFDLYATELWAMSEKDFLAWLNAERDVPDTNVGDLIGRQEQNEKLTDKEKRIFLAAMSRELGICKEVDQKYPTREAYEDTLESVCKEITRKVKGALWT